MSESQWSVLYSRDFHRAKLQGNEKDRCFRAVRQFCEDHKRPGLNLEALGTPPKHNHYSIRASRELRVILALDWEKRLCVLANMGHHDAVYDWSARQKYRTSPQEAISVRKDAAASALEERIRALARAEEWMLFLHPGQSAIVDRQYPGAARIRGAAGTGKTVVALHRAAALGRRYAPQKVLFTTFSRSLCDRLRTIFNAIPDAPSNVDFKNNDRIAYEVVGGPRIRDADHSFDVAYQKVVPGSSLEHLPKEYLKEEIERVIKGRGATKEAYLDTAQFERFGRKRPFNRGKREICYRLCETWDEELERRGTTSYFNRLIEARDRIWDEPEPRYRAAIVDEAQDMTLVGMQLVRALVAGRPENSVPPDGILIADDTAQRIYPGGHRLKWADLNVRRSSETLRVNYRNNPNIMAAAAAVRRGTPAIGDGIDRSVDDGIAYERAEGALPEFKLAQKGKEMRVARDLVKQLRDEEFSRTTYRNQVTDKRQALLV